MATVIYLADYRAPTRIPPPVQQGYDDVRVEFARRVEHRLHEIEHPDPIDQLLAMARMMRGDCGEKPGDTD